MTDLRAIQTHLGIPADGILGPQTLAALAKALGIADKPQTGRRINDAGRNIIKRSEGCRLTAYKCPAGVWTIGFGHTATAKPGMTITQAQADELLASDLARFEDGVAKICKVATDNQFAAMVSLAFNIGLEAFRTSTLCRKHNEGDYAGARAEFARWNRGGGKVLPGLVTRRADEAELYGR